MGDCFITETLINFNNGAKLNCKIFQSPKKSLCIFFPEIPFMLSVCVTANQETKGHLSKTHVSEVHGKLSKVKPLNRTDRFKMPQVQWMEGEPQNGEKE